jgi:hypothetical protein
MADALNHVAARELLLGILLRERLRWGQPLTFDITREDAQARGFDLDVSPNGNSITVRATPKTIVLNGRLG